MSRILLDVVVVDPCGTLALGVEEPDEHGQLEHIVEGDEVEHEAGELVDHVEHAEDHPVGEPLLVVADSIGLEGVEAHEHRVGNSEEGCQDGLADAEHHEEHQGDQTVLKQLVFWLTCHLGSSLQYTHI